MWMNIQYEDTVHLKMVKMIDYMSRLLQQKHFKEEKNVLI